MPKSSASIAPRVAHMKPKVPNIRRLYIVLILWRYLLGVKSLGSSMVALDVDYSGATCMSTGALCSTTTTRSTLTAEKEHALTGRVQAVIYIRGSQIGQKVIDLH